MGSHLAHEILETVRYRDLARLEVGKKRQELMLHVEVVDIVTALEECPDFEEVCGAESRLEERPLDSKLQPAESIELPTYGDAGRRTEPQRRDDVILQISANARKMRKNIDTVLLQLLLVTDSRQHQQVWRTNGAGRKDDFACRAHFLLRVLLPERHSRRRIAIEIDPFDKTPCHHGQVFAVQCRLEIGEARAAPYAVADGSLGYMNAFLVATVVVTRITQPEFLACTQEGLV